MEPNLAIAFLVGLLSTVHCFGMCTGIVGALTLSLPTEVRARPHSLIPFVTAYNLGRITSYALVGALLGEASHLLARVLGEYYGTRIFNVVSFAMMAGLGLYLAGWFPKFAAVERIGRPVWRHLEPIGRKLLPVTSVPQAFMFGTVWGWLPCGLVYSMVLWSMSAGGSAAGSAAVMFAFGLGTLPTVMLAGLLVNRVARFARQPWVRKTAGLTILLFAFLGQGLGWIEKLHSFVADIEGVPIHEHNH